MERKEIIIDIFVTCWYYKQNITHNKIHRGSSLIVLRLVLYKSMITLFTRKSLIRWKFYNTEEGIPKCFLTLKRTNVASKYLSPFKLGICCYYITHVRGWYISSLSSFICVYYEQPFSILLSSPTVVSLVSVSTLFFSLLIPYFLLPHISFQWCTLGLPIDHLFDMMSGNTIVCTHYLSISPYH